MADLQGMSDEQILEIVQKLLAERSGSPEGVEAEAPLTAEGDIAEPAPELPPPPEDPGLPEDQMARDDLALAGQENPERDEQLRAITQYLQAMQTRK